ncbi:MAG TPA: lamin tail domain-containing protein, partial [bacterium]|nr:lamin tail domain-containing protein [bacterium]
LEPAGATPTRRNSIAPSDHDLALTVLSAPESAGPGESVLLTAQVRNTGLQPIPGFTLHLYRDRNEDGLTVPGEHLATESGGALVPGDSITYQIPVHGLPGGSHRIVGLITAGEDDDPANNLLMANVFVGYPAQSVRINELMYRPESGEPEWLEIFIGTDSLDIRGFALRDRGHPGRVDRKEKRLYSSGDLIVFAADSSVLQSYPEADFHLETVTDFPIFNNGSDSVRVLDARHFSMDEFHYTSRWGGDVGISLERKSITGSPRNIRNWGSSSAAAGATPGSPNSLAAGSDHFLLASRMDSTEFVSPGEPFSVAYQVLNTSLDSVILPVFTLGLDADNDGVLTDEEFQKTVRFRQMSPGDSGQFTVDLRAPASPGNHMLVLAMDHQPMAFTDSSSVWVPFPRQSLLFNEFLPDPSDFYPYEFIECVNISDYDTPLNRWQLQINNRTSVLTTDMVIPPKSYLLLVEDSLRNTEAPQFKPNSWPPLPNTGGTIVLEDRYGHIVDSLTYSDAWSPQEGRSYERFHQQAGEHSPVNWQVSLSGEGATPGKPNTLYRDSDTTAREWTVAPALFSPDGDGDADILQIRYQGSAGLQYVTIHLYDTAGRLVRALIRDQSAPAISVWTWDGRNGRDITLPIGIYLVHVEYETIDGTTGELLEKVILAKPL